MTTEMKLAELEVALTCPNCKRRYLPKHEPIPLWCSCAKDEDKPNLLAGFQTELYQQRKAAEAFIYQLMHSDTDKPNTAFPFTVLLVPFHDKPEYRFPRAASSTAVAPCKHEKLTLAKAHDYVCDHCGTYVVLA
jgi:hypothetical protein